MTKLQRIAALLSSIAAAAAIPLMSAQLSKADTTSFDPWLIQNVDSHLCLSLNPLQGDGPDIQVVQEPCDSRLEEQWIFRPPGNGPLRIINKANGDCLRAVSNRDFAVVDTIDCTGITNQLWLFQGGEFISRISSGGLPRLDVYEDSSAPGTPIDVFHNDNTGAQQFNFLRP